MPDHYSVLLLADYPGLEYPVKTSFTLRRVQKFKTRPAEKLKVQIGDTASISIAADSEGRITLPNLTIPSKSGLRVVIRRA